MFAIKGGQTDVVKRLIRTGAVNYQTKNRVRQNSTYFVLLTMSCMHAHVCI